MSESNLNSYRPVIGLEVHVQLKTKSKMFGPAPNEVDVAEPNSNIDEVVTAQPGSLPVANKEAIRLAAKMGLALNCTIDEWSKFDRKHYFYPDLPKGYQISQLDQPIAKEGYIDVEVSDVASEVGASFSRPQSNNQTGGQASPLQKKRTKRVLIQRAHLEED